MKRKRRYCKHRLYATTCSECGDEILCKSRESQRLKTVVTPILPMPTKNGELQNATTLADTTTTPTEPTLTDDGDNTHQQQQ